MKTVTEFPRRVREIENEWITLADGCRLAARIWLPEDAEQNPVPAILEYLPYRKRDGTVERDELTHPYMAGHGYACVRVDIRGNGDSDGLMWDEYTEQEQDDALEVIAWLAARPWCTGAVGMVGISWGGFNGLQVAARRPPALKAIITLCSTDDRYADDIHYMGGCLLTDNVAWASVMLAYSSRPPDPALLGEGWREMWLHRLDNTVLLIGNWLRHQRRDDFWRHGSVCEDFSAIECAVYAVGGWADGYSNAIPRLLKGLSCPKKGLIGPWAHKYPHFAQPGPQIGFLQEALRWWDQWLKGIDTDIMAEPMYRVWMPKSVPPRVHYSWRPGRWAAEPQWPSPDIRERRLVLNAGRLDEHAAAEVLLEIHSPQWLGFSAGEWCPHGLTNDLPSDQQFDDGAALCFETGPLAEGLEILGAPVVELELAADRPNAFVVARLGDVGRDGETTLVTSGALNLTHRASHAHPEPLEPGRRYRVRLQLNDVAHGFPEGHRIRLALSNAWWPTIWPSPEPVTLTVVAGASTLSLPVRAPRPEDAELRPFSEPEAAPPWRRTVLAPGRSERRIERDPLHRVTTTTVVNDEGRYWLDAIDLEVGQSSIQRYSIEDDDPTSARVEIAWTVTRRRSDWRIRTETRTVMTCTRDAFEIAATMEAFEAEKRVFSRTWDRRIPRDLV
jgi:putative CocE/NonD family hydrolase